MTLVKALEQFLETLSFFLFFPFFLTVIQKRGEGVHRSPVLLVSPSISMQHREVQKRKKKIKLSFSFRLGLGREGLIVVQKYMWKSRLNSSWQLWNLINFWLKKITQLKCEIKGLLELFLNSNLSILWHSYQTAINLILNKGTIRF